jgi:hypothetical protein
MILVLLYLRHNRMHQVHAWRVAVAIITQLVYLGHNLPHRFYAGRVGAQLRLYVIRKIRDRTLVKLIQISRVRNQLLPVRERIYVRLRSLGMYLFRMIFRISGSVQLHLWLQIHSQKIESQGLYNSTCGYYVVILFVVNYRFNTPL